MKRLQFCFLLALASLSLKAQNISFEVYAQESRIGLQRGYGVFLANSKGMAIGPVFQSTDGISTETNLTNYPFIGAEARFPIETCGKLRILFATKAGFLNRDFFVVLPEVQTEYLITNTLGVGLGAGIRVREAAISFKTFFQPFNNKRK